MGEMIKVLGVIWVILGALFMLAVFAGSLQFPGISSETQLMAIVVFVGTFLAPAGMMYCVGDLHHKLISGKSNNSNGVSREAPWL